ncbi:MAG: phosphoribosylanthranilate isomerase [Chloroflexi bacterium]|nr:phosphoribosylanthranilate isomerase [Chloroflexota bacterium]
MLVKICGLLEPADAHVAVAAGADMVSVIFAPARRRRTLAQARAVFETAPPHVERVGVFVDAPTAEVNEVIDACRLDRVQLSGAESAAYCRAFGARAVKTLRLPNDLGEFPKFSVPLFHLDALVEGQAGGTGESWDYSLARNATHTYRVLLSGGLTPQNVAAAIHATRPYGVDVSSGVETNQRKDHDKIEQFIRNARRAFAAPACL